MGDVRIAVVTGTSSGIGREIAKLLAESGFEVFGTVRRPGAGPSGPGLNEVRMDVTDPSSVSEAVEAVVGRGGRIDALINNAGFGIAGALEETSAAEAERVFDVNFFGVMRVTNAVLPTMRKQHSGRIVNISSVIGFLPAPYLGVYAASKHALECYSETLDHEVCTFGVRAILVEPGFTKTGFESNCQAVAGPLNAYSEQRCRASEHYRRQFVKGDDPGVVAKAVLRALTDIAPRLRYRLGSGVTVDRLRRYAPEKVFYKGVRKQLHLDR